MGSLSTHILDTANGLPAAGVTVELFRGAPAPGATPLYSAVTDRDGRTPDDLLTGAAMRAGPYTLLFHVGPYFRANGAAVADPAFLDTVPVAFAIADTDAHYHVPLLVAPWGYTTYRGS
jgi:5-hydroxyisourate hydrolase